MSLKWMTVFCVWCALSFMDQNIMWGLWIWSNMHTINIGCKGRIHACHHPTYFWNLYEVMCDRDIWSCCFFQKNTSCELCPKLFASPHSSNVWWRETDPTSLLSVYQAKLINKTVCISPLVFSMYANQGYRKRFLVFGNVNQHIHTSPRWPLLQIPPHIQAIALLFSEAIV